MKKYIKIVLFILLVLWVITGFLARIDVIFLADKYRSNGFDLWVYRNYEYQEDPYRKYNDKYEKEGFVKNETSIKNDIVFGCKFYKKKVYWLNEDENSKMYHLFSNYSFVNFLPLYRNEPIEGVSFVGSFYACPRWANNFGLKHILLPLLPTIYMEYYPLKQNLYISSNADCDYFVGISVTNVPPSLVHLDEEEIKKTIYMLEEREQNSSDLPQ